MVPRVQKLVLENGLAVVEISFERFALNLQGILIQDLSGTRMFLVRTRLPGR